jgi:hypothetical protein
LKNSVIRVAVADGVSPDDPDAPRPPITTHREPRLGMTRKQVKAQLRHTTAETQES